MFKAIRKVVDYGFNVNTGESTCLYRITDDDFEEPQEFVCNVDAIGFIDAIIFFYEERKLNVAANLVLYGRYSNHYDIKTFLFTYCNEYKNEIEKYLSLL